MSGLVDKVKDTLGGSVAPLKEGSKIPSTGLLKEDNPQEGSVDLSKVSGKYIIAAVPGAFTSTCSSQIPGYLENAEKFKAKGVQAIYVVAVNDAFVTKAWNEKLSGDFGTEASLGMVHFLADDNCAFTKAAGQVLDAEGLVGNKRSHRYVAVVDNGVVEKFYIEPDPTKVTVTKATTVLEAI